MADATEDRWPPRGPDRRHRPTRPWDVLFTPGRRCWNRRAEDRPHFLIVDRHGTRLFLMIMALLVLTLADGALTLLLIDSHRDEANPVMARLLARNAAWFIIGKYILTAAGIPWLVIWKNHRLFGTPFRVKYLIPAFVLLYLLLTTCQVWTLADPDAPRRVASVVVRLQAALFGALVR